METYRNRVHAAAAFIRRHLGKVPAAGLLTGTGLGGLADLAAVDFEVAYRDIPHFPTATVESHAGRLLAGRVEDRQVLVLQGRFHLYEGHTPAAVTFPVRVLQLLGVQTLIVTNAAGGLNPGFKAGEIMIVSDHINLTGSNPLVGQDDTGWGDPFPDMTAAYEPGLIERAKTAGTNCSIKLQEGVYAGLLGPSLETPAETRFLRTIGADAVGFSTVHEVIAAVQAGIRVLALSVITNINDPDRPQPARAAEIIAAARRVAPQVAAIVRHVIAALPEKGSTRGNRAT